MSKKHRGSQPGAATPALLALDKAGVAHEVLTYEHSDRSTTGFGQEAAAKLAVDPDLALKTLLVGDGDQVGACVLPVSHRLSLKHAAKALGMKKAALIPPADAERITGSVVGGISPLGLKRRMSVVVDASVEHAASVIVSGGRRGVSVRQAPADLATVAQASFAPLEAQD